MIEDDQALSVRSLIRGKKITNILLLYISYGTKYSRNRVEIGVLHCIFVFSVITGRERKIMHGSGKTEERSGKEMEAIKVSTTTKEAEANKKLE